MIFFSLLTRVRDDAAGILGLLPRAVVGVTDDIRQISDQMREMVEMVSHLPELNAHLDSIDKRTQELGAEVARMRAGVEKINDQVDVMNDVLVEELRQVTLAVHPLRRTRARFGRSGRAAKADPESS